MADRSVEVFLRANVAQYVAGMRAAGSATEAAMGRATKAATRQEAAMRSAGAMGRLAFTGLKLGVVGVAGGMVLAAKVTADFEERMANVKSLSHANATEMKVLRAAAMNVGTGYGYTASQVAEAQAEMVKAGVSLKDMMGGGLKGALSLAAAGQVDVADATEIAAAAMTQFKLKGSDIPHVADLLAAGADKALGSVTDLGYGLSQAGTQSHQMGLSIEDTVGTLAQFAQSGLIGERGGTTLKMMLMKLSDPTKKAQGLMDKYGLSIYKANGQMKSMPEIAGNLTRSFKDLAPAQRNAALGTIFGSRAIQAANILIAGGEKGNRKWIKSVNDQGFAAHQASGKLNSLKGDLQKLKAAGENALISVGTGEQAPLRRLANDATKELQKLTKSGDLERWGKSAGKALETVAHDIGTFAHDVGPAVSGIATAIHDGVQAFNTMPADLRKLLIYGGAGAVAAHKLGLDSLIKTLIMGPSGARGVGGVLGSRGGVTPVFVTNLGTLGKVGAGATAGEAAAGGAAAGRKMNLAVAGVEVLAGAVTIAGLGNQLGNLGSSGHRGGVLSDFIKDKNGLQTFLFGSGHTLQHDLQDAFKGKNGVGGGAGLKAEQFISGLTGIDSTLTKSVKNVDALDKRLAHLNYSKPTQGAKEYRKILAESGLTAAQLATVLPRTAKAMAAVTARTANTAAASKALGGEVFGAVEQFRRSGMSVQQYGKFLRGLPKAARTAISTPGLLQSATQVRGLGKALHLTPRQIQVLLKMLGFDKVKNDTSKTRRALDDVDGKTATAKVKLKDDASPKARQVRSAMADLRRQNAKPTVTLQDKRARKQAADLKGLLVGPLGHTVARPTAVLNDHATGKAHAVEGTVHHLGAQRANPVATLVDHASGQAARIRGEIAGIQGKSVTVSINTVHTTRQIVLNASLNKPRGVPSAAGNLFGAYAGGDVPNGHRPELVQQPTYRMWAEPETKGEAYIPLANDWRRPRAVEIWEQTGRLLDQFATGGTRGGAHRPGIRQRFDLFGGMSMAGVRREFKQLEKALGGASKRLNHLEGDALRVAHAYNLQEKQLKRVQSKANSLSDTTQGAFTNDPFGNGLTGLGDVLQQDKMNALHMASSLKTLKRKGISHGLEAALAASGDSATAMELAKLSRGQINRYDAMWAQRGKAADFAGDVAARNVYGAELKHLRRVVTKLNHHLNGLERAAERGTAKGTRQGMNDRHRAAARKRRVGR